jgi:YD repeat-containing protein
MKGRLTGYSAPGGERAEWRYDHLGRAFAQVVFDAQGQVSSANMTIRNDDGQILATLSPGSVDSFHPVLPQGAGLTDRIPVALIQAGNWGEQRRDASGRRYLSLRDDFGRTMAT